MWDDNEEKKEENGGINRLQNSTLPMCISHTAHIEIPMIEEYPNFLGWFVTFFCF